MVCRQKLHPLPDVQTVHLGGSQMTSVGICPNCQGEVTLHEEHWTEFGIEWTKFTGRCANCGQICTEHHSGFSEAYEKAEERARQDDLEQLAKTMTDDELYDRLGEYDYPYYEGYVRGKRVCRERTLEDCISVTAYRSWEKLRASMTIQRFGKVLIDWNSHDIIGEGWANYMLKVRRVVKLNCDDTDYIEYRYACRTIEEVERRIRDTHAFSWTLTILNGTDGRVATFSGEVDYTMQSYDQLHRILEVIA